MNGHDIALWSAVAAFFGSLLAIGIIDVFNPDELVKFATSILVAVITGGAVYSKQRVDDAKKKEGGETPKPVTR
jgi:hypothetical protein